MCRRWVVAALLVFGAASSLAQQPTDVVVDYDKTADFAAAKTYSWVPFQEPAANPANHVRLTRAIESELEARGMTKADPPPGDLCVRYQVRVEKKTRGAPKEGGQMWAPSNQRLIVNIDTTKIGTLVVELWDGRTKNLVWSGRYSEALGPADQPEELIRSAVKKVLEPFPPRN